MINRITDEIKRCIDNECFVAALALAITIPDICGKAEYPNAGVTERYIRWYNSYIGKYETTNSPESDDMPYSSGEIIYNLRNCLLHQGNPSIEASKVKESRCRVDKFVLTISDACDGGLSRVSYGALVDEDGKVVLDDKGEIILTAKEKYLEVNIINLCSKLCRTAKGYYLENNDKFDFFDCKIRDVREMYSGLFDEKEKMEG